VPARAHDVRRAERSELRTLASTLAQAFDDDPLTTWLFPDDAARRRKLPAFFRALLRASLPLGAVYTAGDGCSVAMWNPPGTFPMGWYADAKLGWTTARLAGARILTCARGLLYFEHHHPKEPHWYLQMLGTHPQWQGKGAGSAVLVPILERCDRTGERVYLESSKERNIPFYERHGFEVSDELYVPHGPVVWAMWREPH
jgi:GNAT superfamily N-acetyltransferase